MVDHIRNSLTVRKLRKMPDFPVVGADGLEPPTLSV